ncbi:3-oxoacyl-ACP reductase [Mycolicibacterium conceptionense]|uniref:3-oxoacyl-ACP reductase n=1 Tax=Mycolicibacterium conceptionense TaxID=451644 RepID=A0A1A1Z8D2_9MYCO|nr:MULTISPECIES: SDR family oxidoreductase [Mycolicibacterium]MCW1823683.1 SDR family oxidoreductase [Mycolicibacterium senegalense]OBB05148.1 3-oxoacyl-ACP reductase [Mycolicibacterium conceptionense]OBE94408.1 3-oxoacyl-ACP reductase [Mycolicibacterium conceptionense]OBF22248.1 3-oxoacyl-ACP reductase [Mycolicibacterium conceptionense]OBF39833.1 3-oxoacyl-ACP reductase [Mycolicibacterium conceptionense]
MSSPAPVVVITGASQGIGAALVSAYRARGHRVIANSRTIAESTDADLVTVAGDVADPATAEAIVTAALERFGRIDTLVNNAGIFIAKPFTDYTATDFASMVAVNLAGFFHVTQRAIGAMAEQGSGHVVSITTSLVDQPLAAVPSALASLTKGGIDAATRSLAIEYASRGIRINAVAPGIIKTPMHPVETHAQLDALHPVGHMGEIADVVDAVLYLDTAGFITGETLHTDGGQHAGRW